MPKEEDGLAGDAFLDERLARSDRWVREGRIPFSSKVIPVHESLSAQQWVLPTAQAVEILRNSRSFALTHCVCRSHYQRCDNPTEVCFLINDEADRQVTEGTAHRIPLEQAVTVLGEANVRGLVHLTIYNPEQYPFALCSCCPCCCHELQFLRVCGRGDLIAHSDYAAQTDPQACTHCGTCVERCPFGARTSQEGRMSYDAGACYGCGLCVTTCPAGATTMARRGR